MASARLAELSAYSGKVREHVQVPATPSVPPRIRHAETFAEATTSLDRLIDWSHDACSRVGYFAALYKRINLAIEAAADGGSFSDAERMQRLDVAFANRYFDAMNGYFHRDHYPKPTHSWRITFDRAEQDEPILTQHLLAGINAHIALDLGVALDTLCGGRNLNAVREDFLKVNAVLAGQADDVLDQVEDLSPTLKRVLDFIPGEESSLIGVSVKVWRDSAWRFAKALAFSPAALDPYAIGVRDRVVARQGSFTFIRGPFALAYDLIADEECRDVKRNIARLSEIAATPAPPKFNLD
jgi:hypothetical protein